MIIDGKNVFMGAYEAVRPKSPLTLDDVDEEVKASVANAINDATAGISPKPNTGDTLSISQETIDFLCSDAGYEKMQKDINNIYSSYINQQKEIAAGKSKDNPFWEHTNTQWMVFSEYLYNNGFYDNMEADEVLESENLLRKITAGMDNIGGWRYGAGCVSETAIGEFFNTNCDVSSAEAYMDLEASTNALRYFADKYVKADKREQFNELVDKYSQHNGEALEGYEGTHEKMARAIHYFNTAYGKAVYPTRKMEYTVYLGGIRHSDQEKKQFQLSIRNLFEDFRNNTGTWDSLWNKLRESFANFTTNNMTNKDLRNYSFSAKDLKAHVLGNAEGTFERTSKYWSELLAK